MVEDEPVVRGLACEALEDSGYKPMETEDGAEALALPARANGPVDLVLSDVAMPRMGGKELDEPFENCARTSPCSTCPAIRAGGEDLAQRVPGMLLGGHHRAGTKEGGQRTGWDSNPRYRCRYTGFRDRLLQPLGHLS